MGTMQSPGTPGGSTISSVFRYAGDKRLARAQESVAKTRAEGATDVANIHAKSADALGIRQENVGMDRNQAERDTAITQANADIVTERERSSSLKEINNLRNAHELKMQQRTQQNQHKLFNTMLPKWDEQMKHNREMDRKTLEADVLIKGAQLAHLMETMKNLAGGPNALGRKFEEQEEETQNLKTQTDSVADSLGSWLENLPTGGTAESLEATLLDRIRRDEAAAKSLEYLQAVARGDNVELKRDFGLDPRTVGTYVEAFSQLADKIQERHILESGKEPGGDIDPQLLDTLPITARKMLEKEGVTTWEELNDLALDENLQIELGGYDWSGGFWSDVGEFLSPASGSRSPFQVVSGGWVGSKKDEASFHSPEGQAFGTYDQGGRISGYPTLATFTQKDVIKARSRLTAAYGEAGRSSPLGEFSARLKSFGPLIGSRGMGAGASRANGGTLTQAQRDVAAIAGVRRRIINPIDATGLAAQASKQVNETMGDAPNDQKIAAFKQLFYSLLQSIKGEGGSSPRRFTPRPDGSGFSGLNPYSFFQTDDRPARTSRPIIPKDR